MHAAIAIIHPIDMRAPFVEERAEERHQEAMSPADTRWSEPVKWDRQASRN
jgi:hypothetical protein